MNRLRVLTTVSIWLVLCLALWLTNSQPAVIALAGIVGVGAALVVAVVDVATGIGDTGWSRPAAAIPQRADDPWVTQLRHEMIGARRTGSTVLRDRLVSLVDDDRLLALAPRQFGSRRTIERIITEIEAR